MSQRLPEGFAYVHVKDKKRNRSFIKCTLKIKTPNGTYPCGFIKRTDVFSKDLPLNEQLKHKCFNCSLDRYNWGSQMQREISENGTTVSDVLSKALAALTGKQCISIRTATSPLMENLLKTAITLGQKFPDIDPNNLLPTLNRKSFTAELIERGKKLYDQKIEIYKQYKFAALAIDAGKIGSVNYFDVLICNALIDSNPLIFKAYQHFKGDSTAYSNRIKEAIESLTNEKITVTGIVGDNLRVQTSSIEEVKIKYPSLFHINCGAHLLHNGVKDAFIADSELEHMLNSLETFTSIMNSKPVLALFHLATPRRCLTRWTNIFDISIFVARHYDEYAKFFKSEESYSLPVFKKLGNVKIAKEVMIEIIPLFTIILLPFAILSFRLENDHISCGCTYGFERSALFVLDHFAERFPNISKFIKILTDSVRRRFIDKGSSLIELLAFYLTPKGRKISLYSSANEKVLDQCQEIFSELFPIFISEEDDQLIEQMYQYYCENEDLLNHFQEVISSFKTKKRNENDHKDQSHVSDDDSDDSYEYEDKTEDIHGLQPSSDFDDETDSESDSSDDGTSETEDLFDTEILSSIREKTSQETSKSDSETEELIEDTLDAAVDQEMSEVRLSGTLFMEEPTRYSFDEVSQCLYEYSLYCKLDGTKVCQAFNKWLQYPTTFPESTQASIQEDDILETWKYFEHIDDFHDLAIMTQRILVIPSSEASCERMFWKQRKILTNEFSRTGKKLAFSRLVFMTQLE